MEYEKEYLEMMRDTSNLVAKEKAMQLGEIASATNESAKLANEVEFWKWMGANYPKDLSNTKLIQQASTEKARWLRTQLQGKGYEWDYMASQRMKPSKILSAFEAGDCPTQPGIDITETNILDNSVQGTYQNKAYLSSNNPDLHNTPKDAVVVTNKEKVAYAKQQGYVTEEYMDSDTITSVRESRFKKAASGKANTGYNLQNVAMASVKAGIVGAVFGITAETIASYRLWKLGDLTDKEYIREVMKAGGEAGTTAGLTSAAMVPVQAAITAAGVSTLLTIPVAFVFGSVISSIVAPCFGRGKYKKLLNEAKYYQTLENVYDDFLNTVEVSCRQYEVYAKQIELQKNRYEKIKELNTKIDEELEKLYKLI